MKRQLSIVAAMLATTLCACVPRAAEVQDGRPLATRTVILVRHGEYDLDAPGDHATGKGLVPLGREQTQLLADRFAREGWRFDSLLVSPLRRARETAEIVAKTLSMTPYVSVDLAECTPPTRQKEIMAGLEPGEAEACREQLERVKQRFLRPARGAEERILLVCHGNVIRYLVCRALDVDPEAWLNMRIANAGITEIQVRADGELDLVAFSDVGHLPPAKRTMGKRTALAPVPAGK